MGIQLELMGQWDIWIPLAASDRSMAFNLGGTLSMPVISRVGSSTVEVPPLPAAIDGGKSCGGVEAISWGGLFSNRKGEATCELLDVGRLNTLVSYFMSNKKRYAVKRLTVECVAFALGTASELG